MQGIAESLVCADQRMPLMLRAAGSSRSLAEMLAHHGDALAAKLLEHGALLFRGFECASAADFSAAIAATGLPPLDYTYRSTPRSRVAAGVFTSTEYPATQEILLHSENAYQRVWPLKIVFCCVVPALSGGETPIGDVRRISAEIGADLLDQFEQRGVRYVRHYHPYVDLPWQTVFQTQDPLQVARFCDEHDIEHEWLDPSILRTAQVAQGVARHPRTAERVFFNQAHLFHSSSLGEGADESLAELFGRDRLPRHAFFGDGGAIDPRQLQLIHAAFRKHAVQFPWQRGDVLMLDNMQAAHGRRPFKGKRQVLASLLEPNAAAGAPGRR